MENDWEYDHLLIQLNHGECYGWGRHHKTNDEDWELYEIAINAETYTQEMYERLEQRLKERYVSLT